MYSQNRKGFTFVELIVVVVILGILGAVGLVSYSGYLGTARDSNRLTQISDIKAGLNSYGTSKNLPKPTDSINILANANIIGYQGYVGASILNQIGYQNGGLDPQDSTYFTYYLAKNEKDFQLMAFLENEKEVAFFPQTYAAEIDYSERIPAVTGKKLGILVEDTTNTPVQEVASLITAGQLDIATTGEIYDSYYSDSDVKSGTGGVLSQMIPNQSCKRLLDMGNYNGSGTYKIQPAGTSTIQVKCDMETDGGGWTRVIYAANGDTLWNAYTTDETITNSTANAIFGMKINQFSNDANGEDLEYMIKVDGTQKGPIYSDVDYQAWDVSMGATRFDTTIYQRDPGDSTLTECTMNGLYHANTHWNWSIVNASGSSCSGYTSGGGFLAYGNPMVRIYGLNEYDYTSVGYITIWVR